ncbi:MAG: restriction endonuclease [Proteobacteria bacterium]|nr:restriction endonuclease [Pseudomonadota bacterium]
MQGQLFSQDFLARGILETPPHQRLDAGAFAAFETRLREIYQGLDAASTINEAQTEALVITKVLEALGWGDDLLPQVNLSGRRREDVPDMLLFASAEKKAAALPLKDDQRLRHGIALLEAKRWLRPLDRGDASEAHDPDAPSSQMLRYLSRADVASDRAVKWGLLTNGALWRLYWQDARSRSEEFFEVDLATALRLPGMQPDLDDLPPAHALRLFYLMFQRGAFLPQDWDSTGHTLHAYALNEARLYEETVAQDLGARVFHEVFPQLADALTRGDLEKQTHKTGYGQFTRPQFTDAYLDEVREATLVLLYRLLFLFYAEDRLLLPVRDLRYAPYSVRRIRQEVQAKVDTGAHFSSTIPRIWLDLQGAFTLINVGDDGIGMPAYNGGLFDRARAPLLERVTVPDKIMAPLIDALSRRTEDLPRAAGPPQGPSAPSGGSAPRAAGERGGTRPRWINYRDLSVAHLGGIYERLLEYRLVHEVQARDDYRDKPEIDRIAAQPASFARKTSGSYYTHHDLVRLVLLESVGCLAQERVAAFEKAIAGWKKQHSLTTAQWSRLDGTPEQGQRDALDPATQILELSVCDPAMGSGHFLVALVDDMADRVLEAASRASALVNAQPWAAHLVERGRAWESPVIARIAAIRREIKAQAAAHGWAVTAAQLDDRHIVRRMILKKCVFGVDKNAMAVELAKTALWLHTFTVGAPLSFLDHHLKWGDSLHGERLPGVQQGLQRLGALLLQTEFDRLTRAARSLAQVADLTNVDMAEARLSKQLAQEAGAQTAPLLAVLDFWRALRWLIPGWPVAKQTQLARLLPPLDGQPHPWLQGLGALLHPGVNLVAVLGDGLLPGDGPAVAAANALIQAARALARREQFFHWWTQFPTVFAPDGSGGFDAVIGNPPWDRIKLQEVEWFAERDARIATQARAADRKALIAELAANNAPLWADYQQAVQQAEANARVLGNGKQGAGDYPLLGGGDLNLYSLFVERAQTLVRPDGLVALLTPSGIAADKGAAEFFRSISASGRLGALFDFENRKVFFPDVHASFKFCTLVFGGPERRFAGARCAFYLHALDDLTEERQLLLSAEDFARVNPNTGAAPIFRGRRDADITLALYARHPVLVRHGQVSASTGAQPDERVWPVKYVTMFHMTNDSRLFLKEGELVKQGWKRAPLNRWVDGNGGEAHPLYAGRMVHQYDHRAASVAVNEDNLKVASLSDRSASSDKANPSYYPQPQYWVAADAVPEPLRRAWAIGFRDIARATDARTMIAAIVPGTAAGNKLPLLLPEPGSEDRYTRCAPLLLANLNALVFDFVARQKVQSTSFNWFILEQLPVIAPARFDEPLPAPFSAAMRAARLMNGHHPRPTVADFVIPQVLALSYTAHDLAPFARDLGYVDANGQALPPIAWDEDERRARLAALDALFFWLYGLGADDAAYVLGTFPIVREQDQRAFGRWRTRDDVLAALALLQGS